MKDFEDVMDDLSEWLYDRPRPRAEFEARLPEGVTWEATVAHLGLVVCRDDEVYSLDGTRLPPRGTELWARKGTLLEREIEFAEDAFENARYGLEDLEDQYFDLGVKVEKARAAVEKRRQRVRDAKNKRDAYYAARDARCAVGGVT